MMLDIVTPERRLRSLKDDTVSLPLETDDVIIPGLMGEFEVLPGHSPFITLLGTGILTFKVRNGGEVKMMVSGGFAEVDRDRVTVMAEFAALAEEVGVDEKTSLAELEKKLLAMGASDDNDQEFKRLKAEAERSTAKTQLLN